MRIRRIHRVGLVATAVCGSLFVQACPLTGLVNNCFGENTISQSEYDDLNFAEQLLYNENSCGRYDRASSFWDIFS